MRTEDIRAACAELMGWKAVKVPYDSDPLRRPAMGPEPSYLAWKGDGICYPQDDWRPDDDRNQSRMVVQRAVGILESENRTHTQYVTSTLTHWMRRAFKSVNPVMGDDYWQFATPAEECEAALRATGRWKE